MVLCYLEHSIRETENFFVLQYSEEKFEDGILLFLEQLNQFYRCLSMKSFPIAKLVHRASLISVELSKGLFI